MRLFVASRYIFGLGVFFFCGMVCFSQKHSKRRWMDYWVKGFLRKWFHAVTEMVTIEVKIFFSIYRIEWYHKRVFNKLCHFTLFYH
jgi:hypothetical protein